MNKYKLTFVLLGQYARCELIRTIDAPNESLAVYYTLKGEPRLVGPNWSLESVTKMEE